MADREMQPDDPPPARASLPQLPVELMQRILILACGPPITPRNTIAGKSDVCTATLLQLCLTSKGFHAFAKPRLLSHVRITRPSMLQSFQQTLGARPVLGRLVKSLHIGPDRPLEEDWWPCYDGTGGKASEFRLNLDSRDTRDPCESRRHYTLSVACSKNDVIHHALCDAFGAASRALDVNVRCARQDASGRPLEDAAWYVRVLEVQAALELYHVQCCSDKVIHPLPQLIVGASSDGSAEKTIQVTRAQLYSRLTRAGAPTDSFDHPLIYARSGLPWKATGPDNTVHRSHQSTIDVLEASSAFALPGEGGFDEGTSDESTIVFSSDLSDPFDQALPGTITIAGNLALARCVFALTPVVASLSLTGFFECAMTGSECCSALSNLRTLNLGPPPDLWTLWPHYKHSTFSRVESLRLCGGHLIQEEAEIFGDETGAWPRLKELQWSILEQQGGREALLANVHELIGFDPSQPVGEATMEAAELSETQHSDRETSSNVDQTQPHAAAQPTQLRAELPYVEIRLHPNDVDAVLEAAPSPQVGQSWLAGRAVPGIPRRLKLCQHGEYVKDERAALQALYEEGRKFWEKG